MSGSKLFYMVFVDGTRGPSKKHMDLAEARAEAKRLAEQYPGTNVFLLKADAIYRAEKPTAIFHSLQAEDCDPCYHGPIPPQQSPNTFRRLDFSQRVEHEIG